MKNILKGILLISFLLVSCSENDNVLTNSNYPYKQQIGYSANDILSNKIFTTVIIEVMYIDGFKPTTETLTNLKNFIGLRTYKTNILIEERLIDISTKSIYSIDDVRNIEDLNRSIFTIENQLAISALFLNGSSSSDSGNSVILGTSYRNTSFVIFEEKIQSLSNVHAGTSLEVLETTIILHEFCHLLGLVNFGTEMINNHEDTANKAHCSVENCLMYHQVENAQSIFGGQIPQLDPFCLEDLKANGGK